MKHRKDRLVKAQPLTIRIILNRRRSDPGGSFLVHLKRAVHIRQFRRILNTKTNERAIIFAVNKGQVIKQEEVGMPVRLVLGEDFACWNLMA